MRRYIAAVLTAALLAAACGSGGGPSDSDSALPSGDVLSGRPESSMTGTLFVGLKVAGQPEPTGELVLAALDPEVGKLRRVATIGDDDAWAVSPSGETVAVATSWAGPSRLRVIDTRTSADLWEQPMDDWTEFSPVWSHDEQSVAVLRGTGGTSASDYRLELLVLGAEDGATSLVVDVPPTVDGYAAFLSWSADDRHVAVGVPSRLVRVDDGSSVPSPVPDGEQPAVLVWSPDGRHVLRSAVGDLTIWSVDGREVASLGDGFVGGGWAPWSPDGSRLAFVAFDPSGIDPAEVVVVDATGGSRRTLATATSTDLFEGLPLGWAWSPDGTELAILESNRISIVPIDGGPQRELIVLDVDEGSFRGETLAWRRVTAGGATIELPTVEELGPPGSVEAIDATSGTERWTAVLPGQPLLDLEGLVNVASTVAIAVGREGATRAVVGIDRGTGELIWMTPISDISRLDESTDSVLVSSGDKLVSVSASEGSQTWQVDLPTSARDHAAGSLLVVASSSVPAELAGLDLASGRELWTTVLCEQCVLDQLSVATDLAFVAVTAHLLSGATTSVVAVDQTSGALRWEQRLCDECYPLAMTHSGSAVLVLTPDKLISLDRETGAVQWASDLVGGSRVTASGALAFVIGEEHLTAVDMATGALHWQQPGGYSVVADEAVVVTVAHNDDPGGGDYQPTIIVARDPTSGAQLWERFASIGPLEVALTSGIITYALPAPEPTPPSLSSGPSPLLLVDGWEFADGARNEYHLVRDDGALLEIWVSPITDDEFYMYLNDRRSDSNKEPVEVTVDGHDAWLFSYSPTSWEALWEHQDHVMAVRSADLDEDEFLAVLGSVRHVTDTVWEETYALPTPPEAAPDPGMYPATTPDPGMYPATTPDPGMYPATTPDPGMYPATGTSN
jgi:outer membrane protein assembly factor BamB